MYKRQGEYRGFQMELYFDTVQRNYVVKLKGETSRDVPLGDDSHGNIVRIDNGIERFEETLADTKNSLENTEKQDVYKRQILHRVRNLPLPQRRKMQSAEVWLYGQRVNMVRTPVCRMLSAMLRK